MLDYSIMKPEGILVLKPRAPLSKESLEWLLSDALATVKNLEDSAEEPCPEQRDRMLELLLMLANLHEYVAHHTVRFERPA